jgi:hypothetical protein
MRPTSLPSSFGVAACLVMSFAVALAVPAGARAQTVEIAPFVGYRVGGGFFSAPAGWVVGDDAAPSFGLLVDLDVGLATPGLKFEGLFSREQLRVEVRPYSLFDPRTIVRLEVDQIQVGGVQEFGQTRVRPFLSGLLGLTRYAAPGTTQVRFSVGAGGGVKLFANRHLGLRLDARTYVTFVDVGGVGLCGGNGCVIGFNVSPSWQGDFTAGLMVAF